ncbi:MAG: hypothetical protein OHK0046_08230 [Anaerolineae bacterium]
MIDLESIKQLAIRQPEPVFSLYLQVDNSLQENQADQPAWRIYMKNALESISDTGIRERVEAFFEDYEPDSRGLALFYGQDLEQVYALPVLPIENAHHFGKLQLAPLLWLVDEYEPYLIVLVDQDEAHFLTTFLGNLEREEAMASDRFTFDFRERTLMPRQGNPARPGAHVTSGSKRDEFDDMMDDYIRRFHQDVAQRIREMLRERRAQRLLLGGSEKAAHAVKDALHSEAGAAFVALVHVPLQENDSEVAQRMLPAALKYEREQEAALVNQVIDFARAGGRGALGVENVNKVLEMQQVELLVASWPSQQQETLERMMVETLRQGGQVELVHGDAAAMLDNVGGIAARLYYAIQPST